MHEEEFTVKIGKEEFTVNVLFKKQKKLYLRMRDHCLKISAPLSYRKAQISALIADNAEWILKKQAKLTRDVRPIYLKIDEQIYFCGKAYRLVLNEGEEAVFTNKEQLIISSLKKDKDAYPAIFYRYAQTVLTDKVKEWEKKYRPYLLKYGYKLKPTYRFKVYKSYWGICHYRANWIGLNLKLIHFPPEFMEAIYWHELCHFIHHNHGSAFYQMIEEGMPDYHKRKKLFNNI